VISICPKQNNDDTSDCYKSSIKAWVSDQTYATVQSLAPVRDGQIQIVIKFEIHPKNSIWYVDELQIAVKGKTEYQNCWSLLCAP